jgi:recombination protein RecT
MEVEDRGMTENAVVVATPIQRVDALIIDKRQQLLDLFDGNDAMVDRMRTLTLHALARPKLLAKLEKADVATIIEAIRDCAALGLMPIDSLAEGYFVPYWNKAKGKYDIQFQPGFRGLAKLVRRSGMVVGIDAGVAYEADQFDYEEGTSSYIRHRRALSDRGNRLAAYAWAMLPGGIAQVRVLDMDEVEKVRRASKAADDGPWVGWYDEMAAKTALRRLIKYLPTDTLVERAMQIENDAEDRYSLPEPTGKPSALVSSVRAKLGVGNVEVAEVIEEEPTEESDDPELDRIADELWPEGQPQ